MKKKSALFLAAGAAMILIAVAALYVFVLRPPRGPLPRVIILGMDGLGWNFLQPLLDDGKLPHFRRLMEQGSYGTLETIVPTKSSVIWTSIATGKSMVKHGVVDWTFINKNKIEVPYSGSERRAKAFWNILTDYGRTVGVINWFLTYPPEEVKGFMVTEPFRNMGRKDLTGVPITYPPSLLKSIEFAAQKRPRLILKEENLPDYNAITPDGPLTAHYRNFVAQDKTVELGSLYLLKHRPVEVFATYFHLVDAVSHFASVYLDPKVVAKGLEEEKVQGHASAETLKEIDTAYSKILEPFYSYADRILGQFLDQAPPETAFILCSDHGFIFRGGGYNHYKTWAVPHGVVFLKGPGIKAGQELSSAHVYDILPTLLHMTGLPAGRDMDGKVLTEAFTADSLEKRPVEYVRTYEDGKKPKRAKRSKTVDEKILEEFRALGYVK